jgi:UDP-N-acetylglucosamine 2-epimerase (non-hydrolysing)
MLLICYGTRPEYIKVKSLIDSLPNTLTLFTGQHTNLIKEHQPTYTLQIENTSNNRLNDIISSILKYTHIFQKVEYVLIQGDTTSALAVALSAFNNGIKVIHLEAGLRTNIYNDPFPEEMNRQLITRLATYHLCPTEFNRQNLIKENILPNNIFVTGNTGLDNIKKQNIEYNDNVLITLHRRDNIPMMDAWFVALWTLATENPNLTFIFPMHPNPDIQKFKGILSVENIKVIQPVSHDEMIDLIKDCKFIISDSGGIQEEASFLNKRVIVCRRFTERPETVGKNSIMCPESDKLLECFQEINTNYLINERCPYGDGFAWVKIKQIFESLGIV